MQGRHSAFAVGHVHVRALVEQPLRRLGAVHLVQRDGAHVRDEGVHGPAGVHHPLQGGAHGGHVVFLRGVTQLENAAVKVA